MKQKDKGGVAAGILATIASIALVIGIAVVGYQLNWWLKEQEVNRTTEIYQGSYGRQEALTEAILQELKDASNPDIPAVQRTAIMNEVCNNYALLLPSSRDRLPASTLSVIYQECDV